MIENRYRGTCLVPDSISRSVANYTKDLQQLFEHRRRVAEMIERLVFWE